MSEGEGILEVISRWEATGLLYGLPPYEKEDLAQIFDNVTRILLSKESLEKIPKDIFEVLNEVIFPVTRRLYRRVSSNFDSEEMVTDLLEKVTKSMDRLTKPVTKESNPIVEFSIDFADSYEDEKTLEKTFSTEEYEQRVDTTLEHLKKVLMSDMKVTNVNRSEGDWEIKTMTNKSTESATRTWNQKMGIQLLQSVFSDTNRGI